MIEGMDTKVIRLQANNLSLNGEKNILDILVGTTMIWIDVENLSEGLILDYLVSEALGLDPYLFNGSIVCNVGDHQISCLKYSQNPLHASVIIEAFKIQTYFLHGKWFATVGEMKPLFNRSTIATGSTHYEAAMKAFVIFKLGKTTTTIPKEIYDHRI